MDVIRSKDLITELINDPERPWLEWRRGKQITQKQLAGLLRPFGIISDTVHPRGLPQGKGYKRADLKNCGNAILMAQTAARPLVWLPKRTNVQVPMERALLAFFYPYKKLLCTDRKMAI
jgi:hypothetical protein